MDDLQSTLQSLMENPEELKKMAQSAAALFQNSDENTQDDAPDLTQITNLFQRVDTSGSRQLVKALEPFLSDERRIKLERASRIAHLSSLAETMFGKDEDFD